jgi:hypothetical protein
VRAGLRDLGDRNLRTTLIKSGQGADGAGRLVREVEHEAQRLALNVQRPFPRALEILRDGRARWWCLDLRFALPGQTEGHCGPSLTELAGNRRRIFGQCSLEQRIARNAFHPERHGVALNGQRREREPLHTLTGNRDRTHPRAALLERQIDYDSQSLAGCLNRAFPMPRRTRGGLARRGVRTNDR